MRVEEHPILGTMPEARMIKIYLDGKPLRVREGEPIAAALLAAGIKTLRYTPKRHQPRGIFCGIGHCTDCMMTVNGIPNVRTCITPVQEGMEIETQEGHGQWTGTSGK